jgi:hypothetical protein
VCGILILEMRATWGAVGAGSRLYYIGQSAGIARMCQIISRCWRIEFTGAHDA